MFLCLFVWKQLYNLESYTIRVSAHPDASKGGFLKCVLKGFFKAEICAEHTVGRDGSSSYAERKGQS